MGGHAFMWHYTPRMPKDVYGAAVAELTEQLRNRFSTVIVPPGLPDKQDHGDIDVYVGGPLDGCLPSIQELATLIGAFEINDASDKEWTYFAIPWPNLLLPELPARPADLDETRWARNPETDNKNAVQVDLLQLRDPILAEWRAYYTSYGCLRPIMAAILCEYGLLLQARPDNPHDGLVLRIECLEKAVDGGYLLIKGGKKWCDVHLTADPSALLRFTGLLAEGEKWYDLRLKGRDDLAALICTSHFFNPAKLQHYQEHYQDETTRYRDSHKYYDFFRYWAMEYVPARQSILSPGDLASLSRPEVEVEVCRFFSNAGPRIEAKRLTGKSLYEPKKFWMDFDRQLRLLIEAEVVHELDIKRHGRLGTLLWTSCMWLKAKLRLKVTGSQAICLSVEDQNKSKVLASTRISRVVRRVKAVTVKHDVGTTSPATSHPLKFLLWTTGQYDLLLTSCVQDRRRLEQEQREIDAEKYLDLLKRKGQLRTPRTE